MTTMDEKVAYVKHQVQTRDHHCHWPGCTASVPPAKWGCFKHWRLLPTSIRKAIWNTFQPGQEVNGTPSPEYIAVARRAQEYALKYEAERAQAQPSLLPGPSE